jgi:mRNA interferase MazF
MINTTQEQSQYYYKSEQIFRRGQIFMVELKGVGSEQSGRRPVMIVQNDIGNRHSPTVIVAAITSRQKKINLPTCVEVSAGRDTGLKLDSVVHLEQIRTIDKSELPASNYLGQVTDESTIQRINNAWIISGGADKGFNPKYVQSLNEKIKEIHKAIETKDISKLCEIEKLFAGQLRSYCNKYKVDNRVLVNVH